MTSTTTRPAANEEPTAHQRQLVRQEMLELDAEVATLEASIAEQTAALARITALMDAKVDHLRQLRSILSPLLSLPNELLGELFECVCDLADRPMEAALRVAQVCKRWRATALATPRIWENLRIPGYGWVCKDAEGLLRRTISSSVSRQLHLTVGSRPSLALPFQRMRTAYMPPDGKLSVFPAIWEAAGRIATLNLNIHDAVLPFAALPPDSKLLVLRRASLCVLDSPIEDGTLGPALAWFASSPCLERLSLHLSFEVPLLSSSPLSWATLRVLNLTLPIPVVDAMSVLRESPKLQECSISGLLPAEEGSHPPPAFTLTELFRLDVSPGGDPSDFHPGGDPCEDVFLLLTCPALARLAVSPNTLNGSVFTAFHARSHFNLTTLHVSPCFGWDGITHFLDNCVTLEELQIAGLEPGDWLETEVLDFFLAHEGPPAILPFLHTLRLFVDDYNRECMCEMYRALINPRIAPGAFPKLRLLDVHDSSGLHLPLVRHPESYDCEFWLADGRRICFGCSQFIPSPSLGASPSCAADVTHNGGSDEQGDLQ
ncbi:hypothetical protein C8R43DRAFT_942725 [Mycena crocata]|nr:hypothetical protein C8R43DRAFT_961590 [Mycena crocata]KAJ7177456.1 hypothetical protein C8R43DRAFT_942725 [Mycena crocata]